MDEVLIRIARVARRIVRAARRRWQQAGPLAPPATKAVLVGAMVLYMQQHMFSTISVVAFVAVTSICYMQPVFKTFSFGTSLLLIMALAVLLTSRFTITLPVELHASTLGQVVFAAAFGFLFFILLGIKNVILVRRQQWYTFLFMMLLLGISLLFFTSIIGVHPWRTMILLMIFSFLLLREYFSVQEYPKSRALTVISWVITLLLLEIGWVLSLLPLGFSKAASVLTLVGIMLLSVVDRYIRGTLSAKFLRTSAVVFALLLGFVFWSTRWLI